MFPWMEMFVTSSAIGIVTRTNREMKRSLIRSYVVTFVIWLSPWNSWWGAVLVPFVIDVGCGKILSASQESAPPDAYDAVFNVLRGNRLLCNLVKTKWFLSSIVFNIGCSSGGSLFRFSVISAVVVSNSCVSNYLQCSPVESMFCVTGCLHVHCP